LQSKTERGATKVAVAPIQGHPSNKVLVKASSAAIRVTKRSTESINGEVGRNVNSGNVGLAVGLPPANSAMINMT